MVLLISKQILLNEEKFINKVKTSENENANIINYSIVPTNDSQQGKSINIYDNIILEEDRKKGSVSAEIYSLYLRMNGGSLFAIIVLISFKIIIIIQ